MLSAMEGDCCAPSHLERMDLNGKGGIMGAMSERPRPSLEHGLLGVAK